MKLAWGAGKGLGAPGGGWDGGRGNPGKPTAAVSIDPIGNRGVDPRDHLITVRISMDGPTAIGKHADKDHVAETARRSLGACLPAIEPDKLDVREVSSARRGQSAAPRVVVGVEASVVSSGRPPADAMERLRTTLTGDGYAVSLRERRECSEASCAAEATVDWNRPEHIPSGWFTTEICGRHDYRTCAKCKSVYSLTSTNAAGQAPSVHCEVCGAVLVEWGSSKIWNAQLIKGGTTR